MELFHGKRVKCVNSKVISGTFTIGTEYVISFPILIGDQDLMKIEPNSPPNFCGVTDDNGKLVLFADIAMDRFFSL
jgi:hypothetical protein